MVTYLDLRDADFRRLNDAATEWGRMSAALQNLERRVVSELIKPLRDAQWRGAPAEIAYRTFDRLDDEFELTARQARNVATVLRHAHRELTRVQEALRGAINEVNRFGFQIDEQRGQVRDPENYVSITSQPGGAERYAQLLQRARELSTRIERLVSEANQLDLRVSQTLATFQPYAAGRMDAREWSDAISDARTALSLVGAPEPPPPGSTPQENRAWWDKLSEDQRTLYAAAHPERVGALDGLPSPARHDANMTVLRDRIHQAPPSEGSTVRLNTLLERLERSEYGPRADRLYLLGINNVGDGLGIVAVGNPDTAQHLAVAVVPGITVTLDHMDDEINRATAIRQTADALTAAPGDVAVIAWLGYDTPSAFPDPAFHGAAEQAAPRLAQFVDGTRVAQVGEGNLTSHRTVIGHSYGSAALGMAASRGNGLDVHDIIVAGSPGMHVSHASQLNIDARHVWTGYGARDIVPYIGPPSHGAPSLGNPYGVAPHFESFGANRFVVDTPGHTAYWTPNSQSLTNQAHIIVGQYRDVGLVHGRAPAPWTTTAP